MPKKISLAQVPSVMGSSYPASYSDPCAERLRQRVGDAAGLSQFGVNLTRLPPGCWSSHRHWHTGEDEFVFIVSGEVVLITESGEELLRAGDCAGFKAGEADGHHLQNRTQQDAVVLEVGGRRPDHDDCFYSDIDMHLPKGRAGFTRKDGTPYPTEGK